MGDVVPFRGSKQSPMQHPGCQCVRVSNGDRLINPYCPLHGTRTTGATVANITWRGPAISGEGGQ